AGIEQKPAQQRWVIHSMLPPGPPFERKQSGPPGWRANQPADKKQPEAGKCAISSERLDQR
ncbi:MAG: hypothetical protein WBW85_07470, partial [Terriglobales bacterium]